MQFALHNDATLRSRYECKYLISEMLVAQLREFIHPFMEPDRYALRHPNLRYPICSLYYDSHDLSLYQQTVSGEKNRFKLRIRTYDDLPDSPVFFEVKRKSNAIVSKHRGILSREAAVSLVSRERSSLELSDDPQNRSELDQFVLQSDLIEANPVMRVAYMREAYESRNGDPLRITIDTELRHTMTLDYDLHHSTGRWVTTPVQGAIIEIKFTERFPAWISDLVRTFGFKQQAVPKYVMSVDQLLHASRESTSSLGGYTLPPRRG